jgi:GNAT superfamily N-acetyltransferase
MNIKIAESDAKLARISDVLLELRGDLYVDDLVTAERHRSTGAGTRMLDWLKAHALALGRRQLQLDSGVQRFGAHRFYLREGFHISSHHFAITALAASKRA